MTNKQILNRIEDIEKLPDDKKNYIFNLIDMAITKKRLKDPLSNALNIAQ